MIVVALMMLFHFQTATLVQGIMGRTQSAMSMSAMCLMPLLAIFVLVNGKAQASPRPHIILIVADDLVGEILIILTS